MGKFKAFVTGMLAGAAAMFLSKKENRDLVAKKAEEVKDKVQSEAKAMRRKVEAAVKTAKKTD